MSVSLGYWWRSMSNVDVTSSIVSINLLQWWYLWSKLNVAMWKSALVLLNTDVWGFERLCRNELVCLYTSTTVNLIVIHFVLCLGGGLGVGSVLLVGQDYIYYTWLVTILYFSVEYLFNKMPSVLWCCWLGGRKGIRPVKTEWWGAGMVICLERGADLHMAQLMPLPLTVSCFSEIQIGFYRAMLHPRY